jgi:hypothetical protein
LPIPHNHEEQTAFEPSAIKAMSDASEQTCTALHVNGHIRDREVIAARISDLARSGVTDAGVLSDRVVSEVIGMRVAMSGPS